MMAPRPSTYCKTAWSQLGCGGRPLEYSAIPLAKSQTELAASPETSSTGPTRPKGVV